MKNIYSKFTIKKLKHYIKEIAIFFVVMTILANALSFYKSGNLKKEPLTLKNISLLDGSFYSVENDKPILIHFWATWCPTCSLEASNIQRLSQDYNVLSIAVKSDSYEIKKYMKEKNLNFKVVNDEYATLAKEFNVGAYPTTFIYDKDKDLIFSEVGYTSTLGLWFRMWWAGF